jgi:ribosomal protection tetracycline resistance protein
VSRKELNLGILAHVDAGKTTLTERLLFEAGVIEKAGSVDAGTTQTDSLALERRRGITIRAAVASFELADDVHVNLIDTPGHPDFIAEVERTLAILDGAVLVVSAVEGVQPQTRILMRALQRLHVPTLIFVNKIDRAGAGFERVLVELATRLAVTPVALGTTSAIGSRDARFVLADATDCVVEAIAENDETLLALFVEGGAVPPATVRRALADQLRSGTVQPVLFGSAITGAGVKELATTIANLLPGAAGDADAELDAAVFKIERGPAAEKVAYVRLFAGTLRTRDRVRYDADREEDKVTSLAVFERGGAVQRPSVAAGGVAKVWGLAGARIGDRLGGGGTDARAQFPPPTVAGVVDPVDPDDAVRLRSALVQLAEQDPLIAVRFDEARHELSVSLYGEVQREVIEAMLAEEHGLAVVFREVTPIYVERPVAPGHAVEVLHGPTNPFHATIGLRIEPRPPGSGVEVRVDVPHSGVPLYVYKRRERFADAMDEYVRAALEEGLHGWQVVDCAVTMTESAYSVPDGPPSRRGPLSSPADFRKLTPIVVMQALADAATVVCEPMLRLRIEAPPRAVGALLATIAQLEGVVDQPTIGPAGAVLDALLPAAHATDLQRRLAGITGGEGVLETSFAGYEPVTGAAPERPRSTPSPLDLNAYLAYLAGRPSTATGTGR